jgi:hypothetical protein
MHAVLVALACLSTPRTVIGQPAACGSNGRPWVQILEAAPPGSAVPDFAPLLRVELASRAIDLCASTEAPGSGAIATVLVAPRPGAVTLTVEVRDALTQKQVRRDVALSAIPVDVRPLTIALAADELLRASWAELALRTSPPAAQPVPPQVLEAVHEALPARTPVGLPVELGAGFVWEQYTRGLTMYGADARLGVWLTPRLELAAHVGLRSAPATTTADGSVQPSAWSISTLGVFSFLRGDTGWGLDGALRLALERVNFAPTPRGAATGSQRDGYAVLAGLGPQGWIAIVPALRLGAEVLATLPLRGLEAADGGAAFVGIGGIGWTGQVGLWSTL